MSCTNIYFVGPMGAGKSTIGRLLARQLNIPFYDSDHEVENRCGADIPWIFDVEGEKGFRERELAVIDDLTQMDGIVMATGGGSVMQDANRRALINTGTVIYLRAPVEIQLARTAKDKKRPLLQRPDREQILQDLFSKRDPVYTEMADLIIPSIDACPRQVIREITQQLDL